MEGHKINPINNFDLMTYQNILYRGKLQDFEFVFRLLGMDYYHSNQGHILEKPTLDRLLKEQKENDMFSEKPYDISRVAELGGRFE